MTTAFISYAFKASPGAAGQLARTMPARLNDTINVKDFGATGDGTTNDQPAIEDAIQYAYQCTDGAPFGRIVFFPPGTYIVGTPPIMIINPGPPAFSGATISLKGAGRDATILRGSSDNGYILQTDVSSAVNLNNITDMTVHNTSQVCTGGYYRSGAICIAQKAIGGDFRNLKLIGLIGLLMAHDYYVQTVSNCIAICSVPLNRADATTVSPPLYSVGFFAPGQGDMYSCYAEGFDTGISFASPALHPASEGGITTGVMLYGNKVYRCNKGFDAGEALSGVSDVVGTAGGWIGGAFGNWADRCRIGFNGRGVGNSLFVANSITNLEQTGVPDPAPITLAWSSASGGTATATTIGGAPHNIPVGFSEPLWVASNPPEWTTGHSGGNVGNRMVYPVTRISATQFSYPLTSNPGSFTSATWNYALQNAIRMVACSNSVIGAMDLQYASVGGYTFNANNSNNQQCNQLMCISVPSAASWGFLNSDNWMSYNWNMVNCTPPPVPFLKINPVLGPGVVTGTAPDGGQDYTIIDGQPAAFGEVVAGGGTNHYKIRLVPGVGWMRVG
jgi:hypothetical protein